MKFFSTLLFCVLPSSIVLALLLSGPEVFAARWSEKELQLTQEVLQRELDSELQKMFPELEKFSEAERLSVFVFFVVQQTPLSSELQWTDSQIQSFRNGQVPLSPQNILDLKKKVESHFEKLSRSFQLQLDLLKAPPSLKRRFGVEAVKSLLAFGISFFSMVGVANGWVMNMDSSIEVVKTIGLLSSIYWISLPFRISKILEAYGISKEFQTQSKARFEKMPQVPEPLLRTWYILKVLRTHLVQKNSCPGLFSEIEI